MAWKFTKRCDGKIAITLDNNVGDFLFEKNCNLALELPKERFEIFITREVEIETKAIPPSKVELNNYISKTIKACNIQTTSIFGFAHLGPAPQRVGGFGQGTWQSQTEAEYRTAIRDRFLIGKPKRNSELFHNEGDAAVGARSFDSIVLTCEKSGTNGPLRFARESGGAVLYLPDVYENGIALRKFLEEFFASL